MERGQPGGVNLSVIPARSGLDGTLINHWAKHFHTVRCWRFPDGDPDDEHAFQRYTQIVLAGVKRAEALSEPDPLVKAQLQAWRFDSEHNPWAQHLEPGEGLAWVEHAPGPPETFDRVLLRWDGERYTEPLRRPWSRGRVEALIGEALE